MAGMVWNAPTGAAAETQKRCTYGGVRATPPEDRKPPVSDTSTNSPRLNGAATAGVYLISEVVAPAAYAPAEASRLPELPPLIAKVPGEAVVVFMVRLKVAVMAPLGAAAWPDGDTPVVAGACANAGDAPSNANAAKTTPHRPAFRRKAKQDSDMVTLRL